MRHMIHKLTFISLCIFSFNLSHAATTQVSNITSNDLLQPGYMVCHDKSDHSKMKFCCCEMTEVFGQKDYAWIFDYKNLGRSKCADVCLQENSGQPALAYACIEHPDPNGKVKHPEAGCSVRF